MKCRNCGNELGANMMFCSRCGAPVNKGGESYQSNNRKDIIRICICVVIAVIVVAALYGIVSIITSIFKAGEESIKNSGNGSEYTQNDNYNSTSTGLDSLGNTSSTTSKSNTYKVNYEGFKLYIPTNLVFEKDYTNGTLKIADDSYTWVAELGITEGSFNKLKQKRNSLSGALMQKWADSKVSNAIVENIGGTEYILLNASISGTNFIMGYAQLNSMYIAGFMLANENNDFDKNELKYLSNIIKTAEYVGDSTFMKSNESINLKDLEKVINEAIKENK